MDAAATRRRRAPVAAAAAKRGGRGCRRAVAFGCSGVLLLGLAALLGGGWLWWYLHPAIEREGPLVYSERRGRELTLEVWRPQRAPNGAAVVFVISGSWKSDPASLSPWLVAPLLRDGFTVVPVSHLSQPEATVGEIADDIARGVRFLRHHAGRFGIDPARIGACGGSAGGHLSLLLATRGDAGDPAASDPVAQQGSEIAAAAVFFPVTDLLNLGPSTENDGTGGPPRSYKQAFGERAGDLAVWRGEIGRELSPVYHAGPAMAPVLILHGDADTLVPLEQSERFVAAAREAGAGDRVELVVKSGKGHGWATMVWDLRRMSRWFEPHLLVPDGGLGAGD